MVVSLPFGGSHLARGSFRRGVPRAPDAGEAGRAARKGYQLSGRNGGPLKTDTPEIFWVQQLVSFLTPFLVGGFGSATKLDYRKKGTLFLAFLLEDLVLHQSGWAAFPQSSNCPPHAVGAGFRPSTV